MKLYRFGKQAYIQDLFGQGGLHRGGRWHQKGTQLLHTAKYLSLAKLETRANSPILPVRCYVLALKAPDYASIKYFGVSDLPVAWAGLPHPTELAIITEQWLQEAQYWVMRVPSAQFPTEYTYLLNPLHPEH